MVMNEKSYTSTPPMGHTACTEPQCLYKGALFTFYCELYRRGQKSRLHKGSVVPETFEKHCYV